MIRFAINPAYLEHEKNNSFTILCYPFPNICYMLAKSEIRRVFAEWQVVEECPRKNGNSYLIDLYIEVGWEVSMRENICVL